ncbi:fibronectin type III domain-containing protein [Fluviicola sp.]|uniref:fibronectin type III domain-containing protein n=1 Tax=Fluviicola sp. TaxID=1917219 RepID=UPI003D2AB99F
MKKQFFSMIQICLLFLTLGVWQTGLAQVSITAHNTDFNTNLNGWNGTLPSGFTRTGANYVGTSASTSGGVYAISGAGFGYQPSGTSPATSCSITGTFQNTTGTTITSLQISYDAFQIVNRVSRTPNWTVTSSLGAVSGLTWTFNSGTSQSSPDQLTITLTGLNLTNNATFTLTFASDRGAGSGSSPLIGLNNIKVRSVVAVCNAPTGLLASNLTASSADLSWNAVSGSSGYQYVVDQVSTNPAGAGTATTGTTFNPTTLNPSTTYYLHVRNNCGGSNFSSWATISFTTPAAPVCSVPTNLAENNVTATSADFNWDAAGSNDFEYVLDQVATDPASAGTAINGVSTSSSTLSPSTTYYFHLRQNCGGGLFSNWVLVNFTTPIAPCLAPTGLTASNTTHNSSDLSWTAQGSSTYEYVVDQLAADPATAGTSTSGTTFNATALNPLTTYYLHVRTNCVQGNTSAWTTISFTTLIEPCIAPTGLTASNTTHNSSDLSWTAQGSSTYEYVVDQTATDPATAGTSTNGTTFNATTLMPLTTYYLHVRTNCVQGNTSAWTTISFTTLIEPCLAPTGLTASNTTHNSSDLSWTAQGSSTYEYVVDQTATDPATSGTPTTGTTYNATALNPLTTYYLHVRTNCVQGNTSAWTTISFMTLVTPCAAPTGLTASNTTHNSSNLSWDVQGSNTFEYIVDQIAADPIINGTPTTLTTYNATSLSPLTTYYLHVRTDCSGTNFSPWVTIPFTTLVTPCAAPTGLTAANTTENSSDLSWDAQGGNTFEYVVDQTATAPATAGTVTTGTTFNATSLMPLTTYYLHVRTNCVQGNTSAWTTISFTTLIEPCIAPTGLTASNTTHNSSDLSWTAQGSSTYEYVVDQTATDPATAGTSTNGTTFNATTLMPLTTYYLHVRTNCVQGNTSAWTTISFTTLVTPCAAPTGLTASNTTHNSSDLSWDVQGSNTFEYIVDQVAADPIINGTPTTLTTYNATSLSPLTTYYLHVRTDCSGTNFSPWVTISFTTLVTLCAAPTGLTAANTTENSSDLSWNAQGGNTFEYVVDQTATAPATAGTVTTGTTFNATTLNPLTTYYLHVRTDCGSGNLSPWTTISFTTLATPCAAPTGLTAANTTDNSSDLSWNIQGGNSFEYLVDQTATDPATAGTPTTATSYSATTLSPSTTYYLHVRTDCGGGNFSDWTTISFTTLVAPCVAPSGVVASNIAGHSANLAWNAQTGSTFEYVINQTSTNPTGSGTATTTTTFAATALTGSTTYYFHIRTNCGNGNFSNWTTISFTTSSTAGIEEQEALNLTAYPNPTTGSVTVSGQTEGIVSLTNLKGQQLMTIDLQQQTTLDVSNLESGMYFLVYTNGNKSGLIKLIKQ